MVKSYLVCVNDDLQTFSEFPILGIVATGMTVEEAEKKIRKPKKIMRLLGLTSMSLKGHWIVIPKETWLLATVHNTEVDLLHQWRRNIDNRKRKRSRREHRTNT